MGVEEVEREGCGEGCVGGDAVALAGDGCGLEELPEGAIGGGGGEAGGGSSGQGQEEVEAVGLALCNGGCGGDLDDAELERAGPAEAGEEGGVWFEGECEAEDVDGSAFSEWEADLAHGPGDGEERNLRVSLGEEGGAGEGQGGGAAAVEDGVNLLGGGGVGGGDGVVADLSDAYGSALAGQGVDGVTGVGFAGCGVSIEPGGDASSVEPADEDHGVGDGAVGSVGVGHAMESDGGLVEVALPIKAGRVEELLVFGRAEDGLEPGAKDGAERLEVDVEDAVGLREQAGRLGRSLEAQKDGESNEREDGDDDPEHSASATEHEESPEDTVSPGVGA